MSPVEAPVVDNSLAVETRWGMRVLARGMDAEEFLATEPGRFESGRVMLVDGVVMSPPSPSSFHNDANFALAVILESHARRGGLGIVMALPEDIQFGDDVVLQPDIVYWTKDSLLAQRSRPRRSVIPTLVVEVLSPSNARFDLTHKRELFARAGVPFHWVVDPEAREIEALRLADGVYRSQCVAGVGQTLEAEPFEGLKIAVSDVFRDPFAFAEDPPVSPRRDA